MASESEITSYNLTVEKTGYDWEIHKAWNNWEGDCSPACDECWKHGGGYHRRSSFLSEWMRYYIRNEQDVMDGKIKMPPFIWHTNNDADNLKEENLENSHKARCSSNPDKTFQQCDCRHARLMRIIWGHCHPGTSMNGVTHILGRYKNLSRARKH